MPTVLISILGEWGLWTHIIIRAIITIALFIVFYFLKDGISISGVDHSDYDLDFATIGITCYSYATIITSCLWWILKQTTRAEPLWWLFVIGLVFLLLCICGVPKLLPHPILSDTLFSVAASYAIYFSLMSL